MSLIHELSSTFMILSGSERKKLLQKGKKTERSSNIHITFKLLIFAIPNLPKSNIVTNTPVQRNGPSFVTH